MFIELVESERKSKRSLGGAAASVLLHTALISLAIAATATARTQHQRTDPGVKLTFIPQRPDAQPLSRTLPQPRRTAVPAVFRPAVVPIMAPLAVATGIPDISLSNPSETIGEAAQPSRGGGEASPGAVPSGPMTQFQVDREVRAFPSNRAPVYPDMLRSRGVEGEVLARFVVDESGRVDMKTFEVVSSSSPQFANAVRYALERARFQPAEAAGRKVAQLVEQRFQFRLN